LRGGFRRSANEEFTVTDLLLFIIVELFAIIRLSKIIRMIRSLCENEPIVLTLGECGGRVLEVPVRWPPPAS
jgi:hypothetical protein